MSEESQLEGGRRELVLTNDRRPTHEMGPAAIFPAGSDADAE